MTTASSDRQPMMSPYSGQLTGSARVEAIYASVNAPRSGARITFAPGARTLWHAHPLGRTLIVTAGRGWLQRAGAPVELVQPGDAVRLAPGEKHWVGATPTTPLTHIAIEEQLDGQSVEWMEAVTDDQYQAA
jgi:quercetin dioxygenase-like cupin family protein